MPDRIQSFNEALKAERDEILSYWANHAVDKHGFIGQIDFSEQKNESADKGSVLNARILWTFSAAFKQTQKEAYRALAKRAFYSIVEDFYDKVHGGIFWSIDHSGLPKDTKNQVYAIAFAIYGLSEYYAAFQDEDALNLAISLYQKIEQHSFDPINKGYFEAFTRDWQPIEDLRLSEKDANEKKTMNTHLHIAEAYANLYGVWKNERLKDSLIVLLETIAQYFINTRTGHLKLFFDENWNEKPDVISYGHDIEAAWLLQHCAEVTGDENLISRYKRFAVQIAEATIEGIDADGGLWYEFDPQKKELIAEKHWWPQAEMLLGFYNAWELTSNNKYLDIVLKNWNFIQKYIIDKQNGEWHWGVDADYNLIEKDKAGFWKCPYHNGRACIELIRRINT